MRPITRASLLVVTLAGTLGGAGAASAQTDVACWNRSLERAEHYLTPPEGGDNGFFTAITNGGNDGDTNVSLLYPASLSLRELPQKLYRLRVDLGGATPTGCTNAFLNTLTYFMPRSAPPPASSPTYWDATTSGGRYTASKTYPDPGPTYAGGGGQADQLVMTVNPGSKLAAYRYLEWGANGDPAPAPMAYDALCTGGIAGLTPAQVADCQVCLSTKGYWLNPNAADNDVSPSAAAFTTNFLRFYPPKWVILSLAYKRLVNGPLLSVLREAVIASNGATGGKVVQKMLPQSCQGQGRPLNQKQGAIDGLSYSSAAKPLAEMLFNAGWYMGGGKDVNPWLFSNPATLPGSAMDNGKSGPCNNCSGDFLVVFSDGRGDAANPRCSPHATPAPSPHCTTTASCSTLGMGAEQDGDDFLDPALTGGAGPDITAHGVRQTPPGTCNMDFADDVAGWMSVTNMSPLKPSRIRTFVVGVGDPLDPYGELAILREIAARGGGQFVAADNFSDLEAAIEAVMTTIISRATSFSAAAITSVQTRGATSAFVPRFRPDEGAQWAGSLARFTLFNEFAAGCKSADYSTRTAANPNANATCTDIYLRDKNDAFVAENDNGDFVLVDDTQPWDGGWPFRRTLDGGYVEGEPLWEAGAKLTARVQSELAGTGPPRQIYTVGPDGSGTYDPTLLTFNAANVAALTPLLKLGGVAGDLCTTLSGLTRHAYATEDECAADVIAFLRGEDVLRQDPENRKSPQPSVLRPRPRVLGDIFHSTPVLVTPPVPTYLCDLGVANQCVSSLYNGALTPGGEQAYGDYATANQYRTQLLVVGANDGMIHAFNAGEDQVVNGVHSFTQGTGEELWAFIPPDLLPKLVRYVIGERHELFVDGSVMVRDIWVDGSGSTPADHRKQSDEYHTVAIVGQREGGRGYTALDVTNPLSPRFLWSWPRPGTSEALALGGAWSDLGPSPPPIGPIAEYAATGPFSTGGVSARERYIVALGGGYEPSLVRGRGVYVLDAWTGERVWRFARSDWSQTGTDARQHLWPVASPVSLIDTDRDGLFDTATVGDVGGQAWALSMALPGRDTNSDGRYDNWFGGRAFIQFKDQPIHRRSPFFQRPVAADLSSGMRIFLGSGDRAQIKQPNGGRCSLVNLSACLKKNCTIQVNPAAGNPRYRVGPPPMGGAGGHYFNGGWTHLPGTSSSAPSYRADTSNTNFSDALGPSASCTDATDVKLDFNLTCGALSKSFTSQAYCDYGAVECGVTDGRPANHDLPYGDPDILPDPNPLPSGYTVEKSRFYGFKLFSDTGARARFTSQAGAELYDANALTDDDLVDAATTATNDTSNGWRLTHDFSSDERTASSALLLGGCTIWKTLKPAASSALTCGAPMPLDTAYTYQADAVTGAVQCGTAGSATATATSRTTARSAYVTPQQPTPVISVNAATGQVLYGGISIEPGSPPVSVPMGSSSMIGVIHWLEVPRSVHDCRHGDGGQCQ